MTLLMFNGFEGYSTPADQKDAGDGISSFEETAAMEYTTGRNGGKAIKNKTTVWDRVTDIKFPLVTNDKIAICGCAIYMATNFSTTMVFFGSGASGDGVYVNISNGNFICRVKAFSTRAEETIPFNINQWYYIEIKSKLHSSAGVGIVNINEQEILNYSGYTFFSGSTDVSRFYIKCRTNSNSKFDDVYVADNQGTENNDFLGDIRIDAIHPNGAGNYAQMTPSAGNNNECVDESELDDSDYIEGVNAGDKDSYTYGSVPTDLDDAAIIALQIKNNCKRTASADNIKIDPFIRTGSTDYSQTALDLPEVIGMVNGDIVLDDPSDSNIWTQAKINACEFGMEVA